MIKKRLDFGDAQIWSLDETVLYAVVEYKITDLVSSLNKKLIFDEIKNMFNHLTSYTSVYLIAVNNIETGLLDYITQKRFWQIQRNYYPIRCYLADSVHDAIEIFLTKGTSNPKPIKFDLPVLVRDQSKSPILAITGSVNGWTEQKALIVLNKFHSLQDVLNQPAFKIEEALKEANIQTAYADSVSLYEMAHYDFKE